MAAGRHVSYCNDKLRDRESDLKSSSRKFAYSREDYNQFRNGNLEGEQGRVHDIKDTDRAIVRTRDINEREMVDCGSRSFSRSNSGGSGGAGDCGPKRCRLSARAVDREPGELSSESGSDDAIESESQVKDGGKVVENGTSFTREKRRKFSPIIWDRDDQEGSNLSRSRKSPAVPSLPPPPPLTKVHHQPPNVITGGDSCLSHSKKSKFHQHYSTVKPSVASLPASFFPLEFSSSPVVEQGSGSEQEGEQQATEQQELEQRESEQEEHERYVTRHISSSRWAASNSSSVDEGEILEEEETNDRRQKPRHQESLRGSLHNKPQTPEFGELMREGSEGYIVRSSESDERGNRSRSRSRDDFPVNTAVKFDNMEVDEEHGRVDISVSESDTDSDDECSQRETPEPAGPPQRSVNMLQGCRNVNEFERLNKIDEGTYGVVFRARDKKTGEIVALKKVKMEKEREGFPLTSLREINILLSFHHLSIVDVKEVVVGSSLDSIFMVMEYMEHDLKGLMETMKQPFSQSEVKCLMLQLLEGVNYLHDNWVLHRDLKTSNLLLNNRGELKICDFGLARQYGSPLKPYTHLVVTLWYRAPELLLGAKQYSTAIDMWSLGCIMAELLSKEPLFNGKTELEQVDKIFRTLGTPNETIWPGFSKLPGVKVNFVKHQYNQLRKKFPASSFTGSPVLSDAGFDLLNKLLTYDPDKRITAEVALKHEWFREVPLPKSKDFMPTFPAQHAQDRRLRRVMKSPDPLEELRKKGLRQAELGTGGVFG